MKTECKHFAHAKKCGDCQAEDLDATWNAALEVAAKALLDSGLQGNTASKHDVATRIRSLKRGPS
jgi:hypothetical protein